jgi:hypothetical protein
MVVLYHGSRQKEKITVGVTYFSLAWHTGLRTRGKLEKWMTRSFATLVASLPVSLGRDL